MNRVAEFKEIVKNARRDSDSSLAPYIIEDSKEAREMILPFFESLKDVSKGDGNFIGSRKMVGWDDELFCYTVEWRREVNSKYSKSPALFALKFREPEPINVEFRNKPKEKELAWALKEHDWTFEYSDDHRAYKNGSREQSKILNLVRELKDLPIEEKEKIINLAGIEKDQVSSWFFTEFLG